MYSILLFVTEAWVIAVAVVIPVVILAAAGGGAYIYVRRTSFRNSFVFLNERMNE